MTEWGGLFADVTRGLRRSMTVKRMALPLLAGLVVAGGVSWLSGFLWFVDYTHRAGAPPPPHTDGIVALTGGAGRVDLGLRLLANGQADKLLLSGIGRRTDLATLSRLAEMDIAAYADRITLGRYAASTHGNGVETAMWAKQNGIRSLIVVTASYHMPRAMAELRQALPAVRLFPVAVHPGNEPGSPDQWPGWRLELAEYMKFLLTASGVSAWLPQREPPEPAGLAEGSASRGPGAGARQAGARQAGAMGAGTREVGAREAGAKASGEGG